MFGELQDAPNTIWAVTTRPGRGVIGAIKTRFRSATMVVGIGFLLLVSLAASAWLAALGKSLIGLYLGGSAVASVYGAAGSLIVILLWVYYSAQIVFFGAEVYTRRFGAVVVLDTTAVPLTAAARAAQGLGRR